MPRGPVRSTCSTSPKRIGNASVLRSARFRQVAQAGYEATRAQVAKRPLLVGIDDHGVARLAIDDERDDAVVAGARARHRALAAVDGQRFLVGHAPIMRPR